METAKKPIKPTPKKKPAAKKKVSVKQKSVVKHRVMTTFEQLTAVGIDVVCERIANGEFLENIARSYSMNRYSLTKWLHDETNMQKYLAAKEAQADKMAEEILSISDDGSNDTYETENGTRTNQDVIARSKLRVDSRKWLASKMNPKKYGDKVDLNHGGQKENPISALLSIVQGNAIPTAGAEPEDDSE